MQLLEDAQIVAEAHTNGFGDFRLRNLPENKIYQIKISLDGYRSLILMTDTAKDVCWEELMLHR